MERNSEVGNFRPQRRSSSMCNVSEVGSVETLSTQIAPENYGLKTLSHSSGRTVLPPMHTPTSKNVSDFYSFVFIFFCSETQGRLSILSEKESFVPDCAP